MASADAVMVTKTAGKASRSMTGGARSDGTSLACCVTAPPGNRHLGMGDRCSLQTRTRVRLVTARS